MGRPVMIKADYFICPDCGAEVRVGSRGCTRCASERATKTWDTRKPWEQDEAYDGTGLPEEEDFDYESFLDEEFGGGKRRTGREWFWWGTAVVVLAALVLGWVLMVR